MPLVSQVKPSKLNGDTKSILQEYLKLQHSLQNYPIAQQQTRQLHTDKLGNPYLSVNQSCIRKPHWTISTHLQQSLMLDLQQSDPVQSDHEMSSSADEHEDSDKSEAMERREANDHD